MEKWTKIRRDILVEEMSRREACRKYNLNFRTIQKILKHPEPPEKPKEYVRAKPKIGPFISVIHEILEADKKTHPKQRHTGKRIFDRLRDEHGYTGGITVVRDEIRRWKQQTAEVFMPLAHPPGEAQFDFNAWSITAPSLTESSPAPRTAATDAALLTLSEPDTFDDDEIDLLLHSTANGQDVDPFVAAVVVRDGALVVAPVRLSENELADIEQRGVLSEAPSMSPIIEHLDNRGSELHPLVRDSHENHVHRRLTHHRAVESVFGWRSRLKDRQRVPTDEVIHHVYQEHALVVD